MNDDSDRSMMNALPTANDAPYTKTTVTARWEPVVTGTTDPVDREVMST